MSLESCLNIDDLRTRAQRKLPSPMFHYIDGGADDEWTLRRNTAAFDGYELLPRYLNDVSSVDLSARVLGCDLKLPFFLAPTGMSRLFHHHKELGVARCKQAGYQALCLTVDTAIAGNRERDRRYGMTMPPRMTLKTFMSFAVSLEWSFQFLRNPDFRLANVVHRVDALARGAMGLVDYVNSQFDRGVTWGDAEWLVQQWGGPFAIKGMSTELNQSHVRRLDGSGA